MIRPNADLFDVGISVDDIDHDVTDGPIRPVNGDPPSSGHRVLGEGIDRGRFIGRDVVQGNIMEALPSKPLDLLQRGAVFRARSSNGYEHAQSIAGSRLAALLDHTEGN
jgi:hypothetical protein